MTDFVIYLVITDFFFKKFVHIHEKKDNGIYELNMELKWFVITILLTVTKNLNKLNVHNVHATCLKYNIFGIVRLLYSKTTL